MSEQDEDQKEELTLKWGTLKGWHLKSEQSRAAFKKYLDLGMSLSAMSQKDTPEHKQALCEMIDAIDGRITNDWSGEAMTKEEARRYILEYDR